jgi:hypothetical protein
MLQRAWCWPTLRPDAHLKLIREMNELGAHPVVPWKEPAPLLGGGELPEGQELRTSEGWNETDVERCRVRLRLSTSGHWASRTRQAYETGSVAIPETFDAWRQAVYQHEGRRSVRLRGAEPCFYAVLNLIRFPQELALLSVQLPVIRIGR